MEEKQVRDRLGSLSLPLWETLPDFGLYMDQLVTYVERCFAADEAFVLTPAMINNYVKAGMIDRPTGKKYARESLAQLLMACHLKQTSSVETMKKLLHPGSDTTTEKVYRAFAQAQGRIREALSALPADALSCALESAMCQTMCRLLLEKESA